MSIWSFNNCQYEVSIIQFGEKRGKVWVKAGNFHLINVFNFFFCIYIRMYTYIYIYIFIYNKYNNKRTSIGCIEFTLYKCATQKKFGPLAFRPVFFWDVNSFEFCLNTFVFNTEGSAKYATQNKAEGKDSFLKGEATADCWLRRCFKPPTCMHLFERNHHLREAEKKIRSFF